MALTDEEAKSADAASVIKISNYDAAGSEFIFAAAHVVSMTRKGERWLVRLTNGDNASLSDAQAAYVSRAIAGYYDRLAPPRRFF